ncbi:MAG: hypothetical protein H7177_16415 [Rhizobacter sp.]|nr:hypothetical protein [Bacteriovorax sp.]
MEDYRISKNRDEIIKLVQKKFKAESMMTVWQKDPNSGTRLFKCHASFYSLHPFEGVFSIVILEEARKNFNPDLEVYFLLEVQDFVFKTKLSISQTVDKSILSFQIPFDIRLKELRIHPRIYIPHEEKRLVSASFVSKEKKTASVEVACPIYNISKSGICIIVSKETLSTVKLNEVIELEGLGFFESMGNQVKAIVKNARTYTKKGISTDEYYALGLEFQTN